MVAPIDRTPEEIDEARKALRAFARAGYELFPLKVGTKIPRDVGWQTKPYSLAGDITPWVKSGGNIGVRMRDVDLVIDDDPRSHPGDDPLTRLIFDVGVDLTNAPTVITGRGDGGRHRYWRKPAGLRIHGKLVDSYKGIDFKTAGGFVVAPGSIHPDTGGIYTVDPDAPAISDVRDAPDALLELIAREDGQGREDGEDAGVMTPEQMAMLLGALNPEDYGHGRYERWFRLCAACHDATGGTGLAEFQYWCAGDGAYSDASAQVQAHWESCTAGKRDGAGYKHLLSEVSKAGRPDLVAAWESEDERDALLRALDDYEPDRSALLEALKEDDHG